MPQITGPDIPQGVAPAMLCANAEELQSVVSHHLPMFYRRAFRQIGNAHDAEDVVQDALLSACQHISQFRRQAPLSIWLTTIVTNAARLRLRRRRPSDTSFDQQVAEEQGSTLWDFVADDRPSPEELCCRTELHDRLMQLMDELSPTMRRTFQLCDLDGLTTCEVAAMLGVPEGTIKAQLSRARGKLTELLREALALPRSLARSGVADEKRAPARDPAASSAAVA